MIYDVNITGYSKDNEKVFSLSAPWWDGFRLRMDNRFTNCSHNPGYLDFSASFNFQEMEELQSRFHPSEDSLSMDLYPEDIKFLDDALKIYGEKVFSRFHIHISESEC